jgi:alpha-L-rhamnosidase
MIKSKTNSLNLTIFIRLILIFLFMTPLLNSIARESTDLKMINLRTEYKTNPLGLDTKRPRLGWEILTPQRDVMQTAYQIRTAGTKEKLKSGEDLLWDSGRVQTSQSVHVTYQGPVLVSAQRVYWQVRIWAGESVSLWSEPSYWEMGLLKPEDWSVSWIGPGWEEDTLVSQPCPMLRREFRVKGNIQSARAYITSLGLYEAEINGQRVGNEVFTPGWTSYSKRLQYQTYDITQLLKNGDNAAGVTLGDGWYRGFLGWSGQRNNYGKKLALLMQMVITYQDGMTEIIGSDGNWKAATGPILMSDIYNGETYDARLEQKDWSRPGFDDSDWQEVEVMDLSRDILVAPYGPPVRKIEEVKPKNIIQTPNGETVFDMGQNMVGWVRLHVKGVAGATVVLKHAEVLDKEGNLYTDNLRGAHQTIQYTLKGEEEEVYEPHFTFQGFRYVSIESYPGKPSLNDITGIAVYSDMTPTGNFQCSNPQINQLQHNIQWGQKGNFLDVPTDCPQRDERMGWTGDAQVFARTACFNFNAASFYTKWLRDLAADQYDNGIVPWVIPDVLGNGGSAAWADAATIVPWTLYLCYGDTRILEEQYESMKAWVTYMEKTAGDNYLWNTGHHFGDWLAFSTTRSDYPGATTDKDIIATAFFAYSTRVLEKTARILNKTEDIKKYTSLLNQIKQAFQNEFITPNGRLASNTQTAYSLALAFDLLPESLAKKAAERLAEDVQQFKHITTGFVGTPLLCHVLHRYGYTHLAYMLLNRKEYPSWLYPITRGATTIWERWDGIKSDLTFQDPGMNSFNHYAYGAIGEWLYRVIAGLEIDEKNPGYKHILFQPNPGGNLTHAGVVHHTLYGEVESSWKIEKDQFHYSVNLPPNTHGQITLPNARLEKIRESGKKIKRVKGIREVYQERDVVVVKLGSGQYSFRYPWKTKENNR